MNKAIALGTCALVAAPVLYLLWVSSQASRIKAEQQLDETVEDSFPASDPPAHGNFTSAG